MTLHRYHLEQELAFAKIDGVFDGGWGGGKDGKDDGGEGGHEQHGLGGHGEETKDDMNAASPNRKYAPDGSWVTQHNHSHTHSLGHSHFRAPPSPLPPPQPYPHGRSGATPSADYTHPLVTQPVDPRRGGRGGLIGRGQHGGGTRGSGGGRGRGGGPMGSPGRRGEEGDGGADDAVFGGLTGEEAGEVVIRRELEEELVEVTRTAAAAAAAVLTSSNVIVGRDREEVSGDMDLDVSTTDAVALGREIARNLALASPEQVAAALADEARQARRQSEELRRSTEELQVRATVLISTLGPTARGIYTIQWDRWLRP